MLLSELRNKDYDKFLACNFAPTEKREALAALFTFHYDISQIPLEVSEPMVGKIKIQWWRDVINEIIDGTPPRPHPILQGLKGSNINYAELIKILDAYEDILDGTNPQNLAELKNFIEQTDIIIMQIAAEILAKEANKKLYLAYSYSSYAKRIWNNNNILAQALITESQKLLPTDKKSFFCKLARIYNKKPKAGKLLIMAALLAGSYKLM